MAWTSLPAGHGGLDPVEEADELLVPVSGHALADHRAIEDIQRGEQRGRAVLNRIVGYQPGPPILHRQGRLGAVERLNLRLLVDRQYETMGRRVEIQPNDGAQLGGKSRILRQLETPHPVRLQAVRGPDPLHRAQRHASGHRHCPAGPVRRLAGRLGERQRDHVDQRRRQRWQTRLSGLLAQQASHPFAHKPLFPAPHRAFETPARRKISAAPQPSLSPK